jgi:urease accessory protein
VGAYTYSQGLEWAVESGAIRDEASARLWIGDCLTHSLASFEAVYLAHMLAAWHENDTARLGELDAEFIASRETAELRAETLQMGHSLAKLLRDLLDIPDAALREFAQPSFPLAWSCIAAHWKIPPADAIAGYLWAWLENQAMAALKAVPLGQTAGQRLLLSLGERLVELATQSAAAPLERARNFLPAFALASSLHETQYTRIFRS